MAMKERWIAKATGGPHGYSVSNSKMSYYELIGFIEYAKQVIIDEAKDG